MIVLSMVGKTYRLTQDMKDAAAALELPLARTALTLKQIYADAPGRVPSYGNSSPAAAKRRTRSRCCSARCCPPPAPVDRPGASSRRQPGKAPGEGTMAERRSLVQGLKPDTPVDRSVEEQFVFSSKPKSPQDTQPPPLAPAPEAPREAPAPNSPGRVPLTTRVRSDFATALKRASLERQLNGIVPNTLQDILEQALEPWLRANGYLH